MEGMMYIEKSPQEVDLYYNNTKIITVFRGSLAFLPASADIVNVWPPKKVKELAEYTAQFVAKTMKR